MNPFIVYNVIKNADAHGERISIDTLSFRCNARIKHKYIRRSRELFESDDAGGFPRHWVKGLKFGAWFSLWFYHPKKLSDTTISDFKIPQENKEYNEIQDLSDILK